MMCLNWAEKKAWVDGHYWKAFQRLYKAHRSKIEL